MSYDTWLEKPYQDSAAAGEAYVDWCEANDLDPDDDNYNAFDQARDEAALEGELRRAELRAEDRAEAMHERGIW